MTVAGAWALTLGINLASRGSASGIVPECRLAPRAAPIAYLALLSGILFLVYRIKGVPDLPRLPEVLEKGGEQLCLRLLLGAERGNSSGELPGAVGLCSYWCRNAHSASRAAAQDCRRAAGHPGDARGGNGCGGST